MPGPASESLWAFATPILWMLLYTVVFAVILRVQSPPGFAGFPEFLLAGLLPWMAVQEGISRSATALTDNAAMVKKTVFPIETLVLSSCIAAVVNQLIAFAVFAVYLAAVGHLAFPWVAARPAGASRPGRADLRPRLPRRDRRDLRARRPCRWSAIALTVVFYATPVVYPAEMVPERLRFLIEANPIAHLMAWYRDAFTLHRRSRARIAALHDALCRGGGGGGTGALSAGAAAFRGSDLNEGASRRSAASGAGLKCFPDSFVERPGFPVVQPQDPTHFRRFRD